MPEARNASLSRNCNSRKALDNGGSRKGSERIRVVSGQCAGVSVSKRPRDEVELQKVQKKGNL
jgi:hypothetical protein